eukprot:TRINITY_DN58139_c0_g1_i1.p1 TRINITY_DN58139_c0_g1~~TRINITY_DN58139_c0_g1_i1.p1  ORF type:complete len:183 (+),score=3.53 TRINITY_DN58139_c0_g1_i1:30-578(+)
MSSSGKRYDRDAMLECPLAVQIPERVPLSISLSSRVHIPPLFLSSVLGGTTCLLFAAERHAPLWLLGWMLILTLTSTALHYCQRYRSTLAYTDGLLFQISGPGLALLELTAVNRPLWSHALVLLLNLYAACVFFAYLKEAWYDEVTDKFVPYSNKLLILHLSMHLAGLGVTVLAIVAVTPAN